MIKKGIFILLGGLLAGSNCSAAALSATGLQLKNAGARFQLDPTFDGSSIVNNIVDVENAEALKNPKAEVLRKLAETSQAKNEPIIPVTEISSTRGKLLPAIQKSSPRC